MHLDDATREHVLSVIDRALRDDDGEAVSRALVAHLAYPHLLLLKRSSTHWTYYLILANLIGAVLFSMTTVFLLYICYIKFLIRKRSFKEHYANWQTTQLQNKLQRHAAFATAVQQQHRFTREQEEQWGHASDDIEGQTGERQKQE
jgi:hypothetical protein